MKPDDPQRESFADFKDSFSYGSRTDQNFEFLKNLPNEDAAAFFQGLLWKLGDSIDDGDLGRLVEHAYAWQVRGYTGEQVRTYPDGPFTPLKRPVAESRLALLTSSGHFVAGRDPEPLGVKNMTQDEAVERIDEFLREDPDLSPVPADTPAADLRVRHGGYDIRAAQADPNVAFPLQRLLELRDEGVIGELAPEAYSFVGATSQKRLVNNAAPGWTEMLGQQRIDAALLVPV